MYAANLANLVAHFWDLENKRINLEVQDEILDGCLIIRNGELRNEQLRTTRQH